MADDIQSVIDKIDGLNVLSFRKPDDLKRLSEHFRYVIEHPLTQTNDKITKYLQRLDVFHQRMYRRRQELVPVEYLSCPEGRKEQRQRMNSLTVTELSEMLKFSELIPSDAIQEHICIECNVKIEVNDEEPLMECLQRHFSLEVHRKNVVDVSEQIVLPNMSRRKSALESAKTLPPAVVEKLQEISVKKHEDIDKKFLDKLEAALCKILMVDYDDIDKQLEQAVSFYRNVYDDLVTRINAINFTPMKGTVLPIIVSIKDNVLHNHSTDENKNFETEKNEKSDKNEKPKKMNYYAPIEERLGTLMTEHLLINLVDERCLKPAFFCIACEFYTLRFNYDSLLNHIFSDAHVQNLSAILSADQHIEFASDKRDYDAVMSVNLKFLEYNHIEKCDNAFVCSLCDAKMSTLESCAAHVIGDLHLSKLSDALVDACDGSVPSTWGQKYQDWSKYLATSGKPSAMYNDYLLQENFIKHSAKYMNFCMGCNMVFSGPRQMLFNHVRQKKHLRFAAPLKLQTLFKNYFRPVEYYASFGNFYSCYLCGNHKSTSFGTTFEHVDSEQHIESLASYIGMASLNKIDNNLLEKQSITHLNGKFKCDVCDVILRTLNDVVEHVLGNVEHGNYLVERFYRQNKLDIIEVYFKGRYILNTEGTTFLCVKCQTKFGSLRSLLMHLVYAKHVSEKLNNETVFRFYLELKHNVQMLARNKYVYMEFGKVHCGVCEADLAENETVKTHIPSVRHKERNTNYNVNATNNETNNV